MAKKPTKTTVTKTSYSLDDFKASQGITKTIKDKELSWIPLSKAWHDAIKLPGFARGYVNSVRGYSNTGKSTAFYEAIAGAQRIGDLPVIFETEGNFNWEHAKMCGMQFEELIDESTGEITYGGKFLYMSNKDLLDRYQNYDHQHSKEMTKPLRFEPVLEDVARYMTELLDMQAEEKLKENLCFLWDSIGTLNGFKSAMSKTTNNMWNAGSMKVFQAIVNYRIPASRREDSEFTNTFICVQKIWYDSMNMKIKHSCGEFMFFNSRLIVHLGGIISHGTKKLKATALGNDYQYGTECKINCEKNHVNGLEKKGIIASTPHGYWNPLDLDNYKKEKRDFIHEKLNVEYSADLEIDYSVEDGEKSNDDFSGN
tara:strand:+ start:1098 stop:2204 length:1107 start_codon:yes stop_codon:yes gene_type:complete